MLMTNSPEPVVLYGICDRFRQPAWQQATRSQASRSKHTIVRFVQPRNTTHGDAAGGVHRRKPQTTYSKEESYRNRSVPKIHSNGAYIRVRDRGITAMCGMSLSRDFGECWSWQI